MQDDYFVMEFAQFLKSEIISVDITLNNIIDKWNKFVDEYRNKMKELEYLKGRVDELEDEKLDAHVEADLRD